MPVIPAAEEMWVAAAHRPKNAMAKRRSRKRQRKLGVRLVLIIALVLLIAGFITRRMLIPTHNLQPHGFGWSADSSKSESALRNGVPNGNPGGENLNDVDRRELDALIRSKTR